MLIVWVPISRPYSFKFFKGCLPQILLGPFLNTLSYLIFTLNLTRGIFLTKEVVSGCHFDVVSQQPVVSLELHRDIFIEIISGLKGSHSSGFIYIERRELQILGGVQPQPCRYTPYSKGESVRSKGKKYFDCNS